MCHTKLQLVANKMNYKATCNIQRVDSVCNIALAASFIYSIYFIPIIFPLMQQTVTGRAQCVLSYGKPGKDKCNMNKNQLNDYFTAKVYQLFFIYH